MALLWFFLLFSTSLVVGSPVQPGYLRRAWGGLGDNLYYGRGVERVRRQNPGRRLGRPEQFQERRAPITQNRQLRPAPQQAPVDRRIIQEYQPQREQQNFRASDREPQRERNSYQEPERNSYQEPQRERNSFQEPERNSYQEPERNSYQEPQRERNSYQEPQRNYQESERRVAAPRPIKVYERSTVRDSEISESGHAPTHQRDLEAAVNAGAAAYTGESYSQPQKVSFQIHGQGGPHSYRYGYDTGVGYNRQFKYEERDANGVLHGRYGYYDQEGKLQVVNYTADPVTGFHAEGEHVPKPQY